METARLRIEIPLQRLLRHIKVLFGGGLAGFAKRVVKLPVQERLGVFGLLRDLPHLREKVRKRRTFLRKLRERFRSRAFFAQRAARGLLGLVQLLGNFVMLLLQVARFLAKLPHFLSELFRSLLAKFVAELLKLLLRTRGGTQR